MCSHNFKVSLEEVIMMRSDKMNGKFMKKDASKNFFRKLAGWHLAISLRINFCTDYFPGF